MLVVAWDYRLGNTPKPYVKNYDDTKDINMQIPDEIRKCVVFISYLNDKEEKPLIGTGFFISIPSDCQTFSFVYLITARHVLAKVIEKELSKDGNAWIRINKKDGGFDFIPVPITSFVPHEDSVDISILPFSPNVEQYDYLSLPHSMLITQDVIEQNNISLGDEVFMTGLFLQHFGKMKNIPIVRVGNISAMPEEEIYLENFGYSDGYLVELRSLGGLSGSPVFVHLSGQRMSRNGSIGITFGAHRFYLLGLLHGHWNLKRAICDVVIEDYCQEDKEKINTGIGIVVPSEKIQETLNQNIISEQREKIIKEHQKSMSPVEDVKISSSFDSLIEKAVQHSPKDS